MSILVYKDRNTVGVSAAMLLASHLMTYPSSVIGVDYHENLLPVYEMLTEMTDSGLLNWRDAKIYQLFEFISDETGEQRIANLLGKALFAKTDIAGSQYAVPFAAEEQADAVAKAYESAILNDGGLDVVLIALRQDGSLLMNRTASEDPYTHGIFGDGNGFLTVGLASVMQAKHPIIVAIGKECREAVKTALYGNLTDSPLAALKLHPNATFILDEEAAEML